MNNTADNKPTGRRRSARRRSRTPYSLEVYGVLIDASPEEIDGVTNVPKFSTVYLRLKQKERKILYEFLGKHQNDPGEAIVGIEGIQKF